MSLTFIPGKRFSAAAISSGFTSLTAVVGFSSFIGFVDLQFTKTLKTNGVKILSSTPSAKIEYTSADLTGPVAIVVGTEQLGLSDRWLLAADMKVKIPMMGVADSLNVATATTLLLYEVLRQRRMEK